MRGYDHQIIEKKWQDRWKKDGLYTVEDTVPGKENCYTLVEYPYPSGNLHVGHWYAFAVPDMYARYKRMRGYNVLFPIGFDSFGLPAENAAIKNKVDPREWTYNNIDTMTTQLESMGAMFDWSRKVVASDPDYYKWTQWLFLELYKKGLVYQKEAEVNWDPIDMTVLANEQVLPDGTAERSGAVVEKKMLKQWFVKITDYAERLLEDLEELDWPEEIKQSQRAWIGKSEGAELTFQVVSDKGEEKSNEVKIFTTRPDTLFGATYLVLAPEHALVEELKGAIENWDEVSQYSEKSKKKSELERQKDEKEKTGVELKGVQAINPANKEKIPVFVADYVLAGYGTGAIMAVPAHDERDFAFAKKFALPVRSVISPVTGEMQENPEYRESVVAIVRNPRTNKYLTINWKEPKQTLFVGGGLNDGEDPRECAIREVCEETLCTNLSFISETMRIRHNYFAHSKNVAREIDATGFLFDLVDDTESEQVLEANEEGKFDITWKTIDEIEKEVVDELHKTVFNLLVKEELFTGSGLLTQSGDFNGLPSEEAKQKITKSVGGEMKTTYRLRDWSIGRQRYWGCPIPVVRDPEGNVHPVPEEHLPWVLPTDVDFTPTGEAPLARSKELQERVEKIFGKGWTPEVDTMDTFVDSSWYFLRYTDPKNEEVFASKEKLKQWMPVNRYSGGAEHTTMHVLYSRFFHKALFDLGLVHEKEPYKERFNRGLILGTDGQKMSKRWGNVVDPDEQVRNVGADTVRMYLAFIGPYNIPGSYPWDMGGVVGVRRFLERVMHVCESITEDMLTTEDVVIELNRTIKKVGEDIESFKFNTAVSQLMILFNTIQEGSISKKDFASTVVLLAPFAPHLAEELWEKCGGTTSVHLETWPEYDKAKLVSDTVTIVVQVNGKTRGRLDMPFGTDESAVMARIREDEKLAAWIRGGEVKKIVYVENKLINIVV